MSDVVKPGQSIRRIQSTSAATSGRAADSVLSRLSFTLQGNCSIRFRRAVRFHPRLARHAGLQLLSPGREIAGSAMVIEEFGHKDLEGKSIAAIQAATGFIYAGDSVHV